MRILTLTLAGVLLASIGIRDRCSTTTPRATSDLRVIDESGEDYLFSADRFVAVDVPASPPPEQSRRQALANTFDRITQPDVLAGRVR